MPTIAGDADRSARRLNDQDETSRARHAAARDTLRETPVARRSPSQATGDFSMARHMERMASSSDYVGFIAGMASVGGADAARDAAVQAKLDGLRDAFSGPYTVGGASIPARPMFRMTTHEVPRKMSAEVQSLGLRAGVRFPMEAHYGQCRPQDLVKMTQALIDAGRLPPPPGDVASRIRRMQWDYGIGVDCAGYAKQALLATSPRPLPLRGAGAESFRDLDGARAGAFVRLPIETARPGDLVTLDPMPGEHWGHNVIVYSHVVKNGVHVLEVDSSWGAGAHGSEQGGFRRDTWTYDATTKTWGSYAPGTTPPVLVTSGDGPAGDRYHGTYRPR